MFYTCVIPLRFIHPVFSALPLAKNTYFQLQVNTHTPVTYSLTVANAATTDSAISITACPYGSNPIMQSLNSTTGSGFVTSGAGGDGSIVMGLRLASYTNAAGVTSSHPLTQCRIMAAVYRLPEQYETKYLKNPVKRVVYEDWYYQPISNVANAASVSQLLVNSLPRLRYAVCIAHFQANSSTTTGNDGGGTGTSPANSPWFYGDMCCPFVSTTGYMNFNMLINGQPIFASAVNYNWEHFVRLREQGRINGGMATCINGLISEADFSIGLAGYCWVDLSRHPQSDDEKGASVLVQYRNDNARTLTYHWFLVYEREFSLDVEAGQAVI